MAWGEPLLQPATASSQLLACSSNTTGTMLMVLASSCTVTPPVTLQSPIGLLRVLWLAHPLPVVCRKAWAQPALVRLVTYTHKTTSCS